MNNLITFSTGDVLNMRAVIKDKDDDYGHTLIIRHVNNLEAKVEQLEQDLKFAEHKGQPLIKTYQNRKVEIIKCRYNGHFNVCAVMDLKTFNIEWCAAEDLR